jgi:hypothetical protein
MLDTSVGRRTGGHMESSQKKRLARLDQLALAQTALVALLLATQFVRQPYLSSGVAAQGGLPYGVPLAGFSVLIVSLLAGYGLLAVGASRSPRRIRVPVIFLITGLLAIQPVASLTTAGSEGAQPLTRWLSAAQLAVLGAFLARAFQNSAGSVMTPIRRARQSGGGRTPEGQSGRATVRPAIFLLVYYGLQFAIWLATVLAGHASAGAGVLLHSIGAEVLILPLVLVFPILAFSTDWVDRTQRIVRQVLFFPQDGEGKLKFSRSLPVLTAMVAVGMLAYEIWRPHEGLLGGLAAVVVIAGVMALLVWLARVDKNWPQNVGRLWLFAAAAFFFVDFLLLVDLNPFSAGWPNLVVDTIASLGRVPIALGALTLALWLVMKGRAGQPKPGTGGLLLAIVALITLTVSIPAALDAAGLSTPQPSDILGAIIICAAIGTLVWLAAVTIRRKWAQNRVRLRDVLVLLLGLLSVRGVYAFLQLVSRLGPQYTVLLAALFLLPPLWVYLVPVAQRRLSKPLHDHAPGLGKLVGVMDGEEKDKSANDPFAEPFRLMQTGCVLILNCLFLYLGTFREPVSGAILPSFLHSDLTASLGLLLLAPSVVVLGFVLRVRPGSRGDTRTALDGAGPVPRDISRRRVVGVAAAATTVVTAALFAVAFPRTLHTSENQPYTAATPGAYCDDGDAYWALTRPAPASVGCAHAGLELTVAGRKSSVMTFVPPDGYFAGDYRASLRVRFVRLARGCVSIETRVSASGYYWDDVCDSGTWAIERFTGVTPVILADGLVAPASAYTVTVTAQGGNERLDVDGVQLASVSDRRYSSTRNLALGVQNLTGQPGQAVISHFAFTPISQPVLASTRRPYQAISPGPGCGKGAAQWGRMDTSDTRISCQAQGTRLTIPAHHVGQFGFTPPGGLFPADYRVSAAADLRQMPGGCLVLGVRMVGPDGYTDAVCASGVWIMSVTSGLSSRVLAHGSVARRTTYDLQATADGRVQTLSIDGIGVGHVRTTTSTSTAFVLVKMANLGARPGSAVLSDFAYSPLRPGTRHRSGVYADNGARHTAEPVR